MPRLLNFLTIIILSMSIYAESRPSHPEGFKIFHDPSVTAIYLNVTTPKGKKKLIGPDMPAASDTCGRCHEGPHIKYTFTSWQKDTITFKSYIDQPKDVGHFQHKDMPCDECHIRK